MPPHEVGCLQKSKQKNGKQKRKEESNSRFWLSRFRKAKKKREEPRAIKGRTNWSRKKEPRAGALGPRWGDGGSIQEESKRHPGPVA